MIALVTNLESTDTYPSNGRHCLGIHKGLAGKEAMKIKKKNERDGTRRCKRDARVEVLPLRCRNSDRVKVIILK